MFKPNGYFKKFKTLYIVIIHIHLKAASWLNNFIVTLKLFLTAVFLFISHIIIQEYAKILIGQCAYFEDIIVLKRGQKIQNAN